MGWPRQIDEAGGSGPGGVPSFGLVGVGSFCTRVFVDGWPVLVLEVAGGLSSLQ